MHLSLNLNDLNVLNLTRTDQWHDQVNRSLDDASTTQALLSPETWVLILLWWVYEVQPEHAHPSWSCTVRQLHHAITLADWRLCTSRVFTGAVCHISMPGSLHRAVLVIQLPRHKTIQARANRVCSWCLILFGTGLKLALQMRDRAARVKLPLFRCLLWVGNKGSLQQVT